MSFYQEGPTLSNQFTSDLILQDILKHYLPADVYSKVEGDLIHLGERTINEIHRLGLEAQDKEPVLYQYEAWGKRIDEIRLSPAWDKLKEIAAEENLIKLGYSREFKEYSRIIQMAKIYLYTPSCAIYTCPLAMTDGAARVIELLGDDKLKQIEFSHLTSNDPDIFWTAGQWMTERIGGSDVSKTETVARIKDGKYYLYGDKWFTSAAAADIAMTLARIEDEDGKHIEGNRGLSLFVVKLKGDDGKYNNIQVKRLKDKLGTRALPTAELTLDGTPAELIGEIGRGVKNIATILNITRMYNAISSIAYMRRGIAIAEDYAKKRFAFGKPLADLPLHVKTLASMDIDLLGAMHLVFYVVKLTGKIDMGIATNEEEAIWRILTPVAKLYTGKMAVNVTSEAMEAVGGIGYVEDSEIPTIVRDSHVFPIWEGTTNVLSLDVWRSQQKENAIIILLNYINHKLESIDKSELSDITYLDKFIKYMKDSIDFFGQVITLSRENMEIVARDISFIIAEITISYLLLEMSITNQTRKEYYSNAFSLWVNRLHFPDLDEIIKLYKLYSLKSEQLVQ